MEEKKETNHLPEQAHHAHSHEEADHVHVHEEEHAHDAEHTHGEGAPHAHTHSHAHTKAVLARLSRAAGHLESVRRMVERGEDCADVLIQLSAVISALNSTGRVILKDHISHCIVDAVEEGDSQAIENLGDAIDRFMR